MALQEVQAAREALAVCSCLDRHFFSVWNLDPSWLFTEFIETTTLIEPSQLTAEAVFLTVLARHKLSSETRLEALSEAELQNFVSTVFEKKTGGGFCLISTLSEDMLVWLASFYDGIVPPSLQSYTLSVLERFDAAFSSLATQKTIEKRYVDKLLFKKEP